MEGHLKAISTGLEEGNERGFGVTGDCGEQQLSELFVVGEDLALGGGGQLQVDCFGGTSVDQFERLVEVFDVQIFMVQLDSLSEGC